MSWKIRTDALVTQFPSFNNIGKLDRTSAVAGGHTPPANIRTRALSKLLCYKYIYIVFPDEIFYQDPLLLFVSFGSC